MRAQRQALHAALDTPLGQPRGDRCGCAHVLRRAARASGGKLVAALAPTSGQNGSTCTGTHAQAKSMRLSPPAIVGLKRPLTQGQLRVGMDVARSPCNATKATARPTLEGTGVGVAGQTPGPMYQPCYRSVFATLITLREQEKRVPLSCGQPVDGSGLALLASAPHQRGLSAVHLAAGSGAHSPCTACGQSCGSGGVITAGKSQEVIRC
jgi:hypothetical protein